MSLVCIFCWQYVVRLYLISMHHYFVLIVDSCYRNAHIQVWVQGDIAPTLHSRLLMCQMYILRIGDSLQYLTLRNFTGLYCPTSNPGEILLDPGQCEGFTQPTWLRMECVYAHISIFMTLYSIIALTSGWCQCQIHDISLDAVSDTLGLFGGSLWSYPLWFDIGKDFPLTNGCFIAEVARLCGQYFK